MMKNNKYLKVGVAVLLSGVLLLGIALTGNAASNGYEQLKMLLREEPVQLNNMALHMNVEISEQGTSIIRVAGDVKADKDAKNMSGQFQISGKAEEKAFDVYRNGDAVLFHMSGSENWYQTTSQDSSTGDENIPGRFDEEGMKENPKLREAFMDTIMGDYKDQIILEESNGLRTFSLSFDKGNMPVLVQAAFSAGNRNDETNIPDTFDMTGLPAELQNVITDMKAYSGLVNISGDKALETLRVSMTVDQKNQPVATELSASISGIAKDGTAHTYDISARMNMSGLNTTVPDKANVTPSSIITIDSTQFENAKNFRMMHR